MRPRWDGDDRGRGIAAAEQLVPGAGELVAAFRHPTWVAEEPERHLLPHVEAWCRQDRRLRLTRACPDGSGAFVLDLEGGDEAPGGVGEVRAAAFALIGSFAESATYVRQRWIGRDEADADLSLQFEVGTGELASDGRFEPHGHAVLINYVGPPLGTRS